VLGTRNDRGVAGGAADDVGAYASGEGAKFYSAYRTVACSQRNSVAAGNNAERGHTEYPGRRLGAAANR